jgi:murein L,D-transpeptidase YafK
MVMKRIASAFSLVCIISLLGSTYAFKESTDPGKPGSVGKKKIATVKKPTGIVYPPSPYKIIIDKSDYTLMLYDEDGWLATYPVVFGNKKQDDKKMEGDRLTPNGKFRITLKKNHKEWGCFLLLDYPNKESYEKFNERKKKGQIPKTAKIGGGIGIHGTRPAEEFAVDKFMNWTNGCISVKYSDIFELYEMIPLGTEVEVRD